MLVEGDGVVEAPHRENVRTACRGGVGRITLDRPEKLNALTLDMVRTIAETVEAWRTDAKVAVLLFEGAGTRAFCAGGDIGQLFVSSHANDGRAQTFWTAQYRLDSRIAVFPKPIVALMAGIVMGGGVGLSSHASHRIVTESTRLAMPETAIGIIPDVGATWLLSRAPGETGTYLALTGAQVGAADAIAMGLADRFVPQAEFAALRTALEGGEPHDASDVFAIVDRFAVAPETPPLAEHRQSIDRAFAHDTVEEILAALRADGSTFARETERRIGANSPTSSKLTLRALREARELSSLAECLRLEYRIMNRRLEAHDLREGIRAVVIDKDRAPAWQPAYLGEVTPDVLDAHFVSLGENELRL